ncbi:hypothetical protein V5799_022294 [Amblyomma americanum]|uniref:Uncharacterized protein n=1 Tax=Amblyomma americanum TaxID=6943 RepID=A0AAQ4FL95_AMBAM
MFKFLEFGLKGEKQVEVALSSTLALMTYQMKKKVTSPVKFGEPCVRRHAQHFTAYCLEKLPGEQEHSDSVTAVGFDGTTLFTFETAATVEKKASEV